MSQTTLKPLSFYPGCSGTGTSMEYNSSTKEVCRVLDIPLIEVPDWNCCGSTPAHTVDHVLSAALCSRNFAQAEESGLNEMITPCPSCLKNMRNALLHMEDPLFRARVDAVTERPLQLDHNIKSFLQVLVEDIGLDAVRAKIRRPLTGLKVVCYHGCLMNRPQSTMQFDDPENPVEMDKLMEALGAEVLPFPLKVNCCGAAFSIPTRNVVPRLSGRILEMAVELGADAVVAACPMCQMNLDLRQAQINRANKTKLKIPVPYFTQLMGYAFGSDESVLGFGKLAVDMTPAFAAMTRRAEEIDRASRDAREKAAARAAALREKEEREAAEKAAREAEAAEKAEREAREAAERSARAEAAREEEAKRQAAMAAEQAAEKAGEAEKHAGEETASAQPPKSGTSVEAADAGAEAAMPGPALSQAAGGVDQPEAVREKGGPKKKGTPGNTTDAKGQAVQAKAKRSGKGKNPDKVRKQGGPTGKGDKQ